MTETSIHGVQKGKQKYLNSGYISKENKNNVKRGDDDMTNRMRAATVNESWD